MINKSKINGNGVMDSYEDRPISAYDNLNNVTVNMDAIATTLNSRKPKTAKVPTVLNEKSTVTPPSSTKTNGAAHSTPFADNSFVYNESNIPQQKQKQKQEQIQINGNRNPNEISANTSNAAAYATPYKISAIKPVVITTASPPLTAQQQHSPSLTTTEMSKLTSSPSLLHTIRTTTPTPTAATNPDRLNNFNRPLSQHSQSELNDTSHSIAAVKAALNEAKSKFFGLNGCTPSQKQYQDPQHSSSDELLVQHTPNTIHPAQRQQVQRPQPKYQNIPDNSAFFRNQISNAGADANNPPELPPKPIEYQNPQQSPTRSIRTTTPDRNRKMPAAANTYNQISLNDIDGAASISQTVYMATTVPQNIKSNKIAGRHTPTRSSLRHSRMLVVNNKHYEEVQHPNPMGFKQPNLARWFLVLQIIVGILLLSLSVWIFFLTPNTPVQDNPYWCGFVLLVTGIIGLIVIRYQRFKRAKTREHCFVFLRMDSYIFSLLSVLLCCVALIFAAIHYCRLNAPDTKCKSMNILLEHGSCICTFNAPTTTANGTELLLSESSLNESDTNQITDNSYNVEYRDLSCQEVTGPWTSILGLSFILNSLGFVISLAYIVLLACCRKPSKRYYTTVRTSTF